MFKMSLHCLPNVQEKRTAQEKAAKRQEFGSKAVVDVWRLPHFGRIKEGINHCPRRKKELQLGMNKSLVCTLTLHYISDNLISCTFHHCRFFFGFPKDFSISFDAKFILSRSKKLPSQALHQKLKLNSFPLNIMCKRFLALVKAELQHQFPHHFWI